MHKKYFLFCITLVSLVQCQTEKSPKSGALLTSAIHQAVQSAHRKATVGIKIVSLKNDTIVYQKSADQLFIPASNTKLITAASALEILGPEHRFETQLVTDALLTPSKIHNLYIKGGGDPSLETSNLEDMVKKLRARGIKEIKGNIIIDASIFDDRPHAQGWSKGDGPIFDKSPVNGLMLNHCCLTVRVKPARVPGHKPQISLDPAVDYIKIINKARTTLSAKKRSLHVARTSASEKKIIISGTIAKKSKQKGYLIVLDHPDLYAAHVLQSLLKKHNIICRGSIIAGKSPYVATYSSRVRSSNKAVSTASNKALILARHHSEPVSQLIRFMMKTSDNLYADALFKKMGTVMYGQPGTWVKGAKAVERFLIDEVGFKTGSFDIFDGSGLSHANLVSPNHLVNVLSWIYKHSVHKNLFIESLPISGIDGTLKHRMRHKRVHSLVKAKTGTLNGVSSLAGYVTPKNSNPLLFVILVNRKNKSALEFKRKLEDHICTLLATHAFCV